MTADPGLARDAPDARRGAARPQGERPPFLAFVADEASEGALLGGLAEMVSGIQVRRGDVRSATRVLEREQTPETLLVDVSSIEDPVGALEALAGVCTPDVRVLVIGDRTDIGFYRQLTRELCVSEYLSKPLTRDLVARLLGPVLAGSEGEAEPARRRGHVITVCGARGGCGASTVAVNLALELAAAHHGHVALVDLHLCGGTSAMMLGVRPGTGLRVVLEQPDRVDALFLDRAAIPITERLRLIAAEEPLDTAPQPSEDGVRRLLDMLRQRFNQVVIDLPVPPGPAERIALAEARHCVIVLGGDVAGIRDAVRLRKLVGTSGGGPRILTVLNRAGMPGGLKPKLVEEGLGGPPDAVIPYLPRQLPRAFNLGRPAVRESAALRRALGPLTQEIAAVRSGTGTLPLLSRLLGRRRGA